MCALTAALALVMFLPSLQDTRPGCAALTDCREQAQAAAAAGDYERFHDLAWATVQKGRRNDPELMLMLARAQSLSGRPLDALVMLRRIADLGVAPDVAADDDFRRVRALPGWPELERRLAGLPPAAKPAATPDPVPTPPPTTEAAESVPSSPAAVVPKAAVIAEATGAELLEFRASPFTPAGLAYDRVSKRFIVGDRLGQRLAVVDEFSHQLSTLAGARGSGFGDVAALEIDPREGHLWVISHGEGSRLHKLQLISARALASFEPPAGQVPARFVDVALAPPGNVLVLDAGARRILRLGPGASRLQSAAGLGGRVPVSIAPAPGGVAYVAHEGGLARVVIDGDGVVDVTAPADVPLTGLVRVRWHERSIVAIQKVAEGHRAVRLRLARDGRSVVALAVLDADIDSADPSAASLVGGTLYYLASGAGEGGMVIRRVTLK